MRQKEIGQTYNITSVMVCNSLESVHNWCINGQRAGFLNVVCASSLGDYSHHFLNRSKKDKYILSLLFNETTLN